MKKKKLIGYFLISLILPLVLLIIDYFAGWTFPFNWTSIKYLKAFVGGYIIETVILIIMLLGYFGEKLIRDDK